MNDLDDSNLLLPHIPSDSIFLFHRCYLYANKLHLLDHKPYSHLHQTTHLSLHLSSPADYYAHQYLQSLHYHLYGVVNICAVFKPTKLSSFC